MATLSKKKKTELRAEYRAMRENRSERLAWCSEKARENGMSYGEFVSLLKI